MDDDRRRRGKKGRPTNQPASRTNSTKRRHVSFQQWCESDFIASAKVRAMDTPTRLLYREVLQTMFNEGGFLPNSVQILSKIFHLDAKWRHRLTTIVNECLVVRDGKLTHPRILSEYQRASYRRERQAEGGRMTQAKLRLSSSLPPVTEQNRTEQNRTDDGSLSPSSSSRRLEVDGAGHASSPGGRENERASRDDTRKAGGDKSGAPPHLVDACSPVWQRLRKPPFKFGLQTASRLLAEHGYTEQDLDAWEEARSWMGDVAMRVNIQCHKHPDEVEPDRPANRLAQPVNGNTAPGVERRLECLKILKGYVGAVWNDMEIVSNGLVQYNGEVLSWGNVRDEKLLRIVTELTGRS